MSQSTSPFWDFSLRTYRLAGVPPACLALQDQGGADVNVALFLLFQATRGLEFDQALVGRLDAAVAAWRTDIVVRLRQVRLSLKPLEADPAVANLRRQVKQVELESERLQQEFLFATASGWGVPAAAVPALGAAHLARYAAHLGSSFAPDASAALVAAAFG